jgi:hypothetical protein
MLWQYVQYARKYVQQKSRIDAVSTLFPLEKRRKKQSRSNLVLFKKGGKNRKKMLRLMLQSGLYYKKLFKTQTLNQERLMMVRVR